MTHTIEATVLAVFVLATSIWVGGYVAIVVVARVSSGVLDPPTRVAFFRALGQRYFWVGAPALLVALGTGGLLARDATDRGLFVVIACLAAVLVACFCVAVAQARRMTRLRRDLTASPDDNALQARVARGARTAGLLRAALGLLSVALVVLGAFLAI
jgi:uncharacterized membrane protein